jgi:microcystin-dependent protein
MSAPFVAEIRVFGFNFAPKGWAMCNGQLLPISQNTALFSLLGTFYGGDGRSNFALPDLRGAVPLHVGGNQPGPGLSVYDLGETGGSQSVILQNSEIPLHNHFVNADTGTAATADPNGGVYMRGHFDDGLGHTGGVQLYSTAAPSSTMNVLSLSPTGNNSPHNNMMPTLTLNFCIAMQGIFPARP